MTATIARNTVYLYRNDSLIEIVKLADSAAAHRFAVATVGPEHISIRIGRN